MNVFGESINRNHDDIFIGGLGQSFEEIHANVSPWFFRDG